MSSFGPTVYAVTDTNEQDIVSAANDAIERCWWRNYQNTCKE